MKFTIEIRDYECGSTTETLTTDRLERMLTKMLDRDESDGIVIVTQTEEA